MHIKEEIYLDDCDFEIQDNGFITVNGGCLEGFSDGETAKIKKVEIDVYGFTGEVENRYLGTLDVTPLILNSKKCESLKSDLLDTLINTYHRYKDAESLNKADQLNDEAKLREA